MPAANRTCKPHELLKALGYASLADWARTRGFRPGTVYETLRRWWPRRDERPHGGIARAVMAALERDLAGAEPTEDGR